MTRLFVLLSLVASLGFADDVPAPKLVADVNAALKQLTAVESPWKSVDLKTLHFGMYDSGAKTPVLFLRGYSEAELKAARVDFHRVKDIEGLVSVDAPTPILTAKNESKGEKGESSETVETGGRFLYPKNWAPGFPNGSKLQLLDDTKAPLFAVDYGILAKIPEGYLKKLVSSPTYLAGVMVHEIFHQYQSKLFDKTKRDSVERDLEKCAENKAWLKDLATEFADWAALRKEKGDLKPLLKQILDRRAAAAKTEKACWDSVEGMEVVEGTAVYFSTQTAKAARLEDAADSLRQYEKRRLDVGDPEIFEGGREFYYVTGSYLCEALDRIEGGKDWQKQIEAGKTLVEVARKAVTP